MEDDPPARRSVSIQRYARSGINAASVGVSLGFGAATTGTKIGFGIARGITTTAVNIGSTIFDYAWGGDVNTAATLNAGIVQGLRWAETLVLTPMQIGETIASSSLVAASSTLDALAKLLGSEEPSFTLGAFVQLVRREWNDPVMAEYLPEKKFSLWDTTRALVAWASLQAVTWDFAQNRMLAVLSPVPRGEWAAPLAPEDTFPTADVKDVHVTSNVHFPDQMGELMTAEIGEASTPPLPGSSTPPPSGLTETLQPPRLAYPLLRADLRRCSKLCLGSYGGAGMIFFGIPMPTSSPEDPPPPVGAGASGRGDATTLVDVVQESEVEARAAPTAKSEQRRFWDIVWGKHDREIFESFVFKTTSGEVEGTTEQRVTATVGAEEYLPRFWVLTDHVRRQVVLVLRGTMSFKELAIDLTCEAIDFTIGHSSPNPGGSSFDGFDGPGSGISESQPGHAEASRDSTHKVHSGIWRIAKEMGDIGRPVTRAVAVALLKNKGYDLVLCGHSLGAGIAAMLALMWADPVTCKTIRSSGLPGDRRVSAYCYAPPCVTSPELSKLCSSLVCSFVFSQDLVARLSLGSVRDLVRCAWWLSYGTNDPSESCASIMTRIASYQSGGGTPEEREEISQQFIALRKTLEANMQMAELFPTGRVLIALKPADLPSNMPSSTDSDNELQLYEVNNVEVAFNQITFAKDMLSCHLPHHYDRILHEFL